MKPILFNTSMVQAILDGRKTVTRRIIKPQPGTDQVYPLGCCVDGDRVDIGKFGFGNCECGGRILYVRMPYNAGDILYVRETYCPNYFDTSIAVGLEYNRNAYKADYRKETIGHIVPEPKWKPSIHMPKEAVRIFLRVLSVHAERLQDMSHYEAEREGIYYYEDCGFTWERSPQIFLKTPMSSMEFLWDLTYKKQNYAWRWAANPWVWVIEFERCEKPVEYSPW